jgi:hypothetical protein
MKSARGLLSMHVQRIDVESARTARNFDVRLDVTLREN